LIYHQHYGEQKQQTGLDDFAVWMCGKYLVELFRRNVKYDGHNDVVLCFIVQSVHDQYIRNDADHKIEAIDPAGFHQVALTDNNL
jgi:hypothetical protein